MIKPSDSLENYIENNLDKDLFYNFEFHSNNKTYTKITKENLLKIMNYIHKNSKNKDVKDFINTLKDILEKGIKKENIDTIRSFLAKNQQFLRNELENNINLQIFVLNYILYLQKMRLSELSDRFSVNDNRKINYIINVKVLFDLLKLSPNTVYTLYKKLLEYTKKWLKIPDLNNDTKNESQKINHFFQILTDIIGKKINDYNTDEDTKLKYLTAKFYSFFLKIKKFNENYIINFLHTLEIMEGKIDNNTLSFLKKVIPKEKLKNLENSNNSFVFTLKDYFDYSHLLNKYFLEKRKHEEDFSLASTIGESSTLDIFLPSLLSEIQKEVNKLVIKNENIEEEQILQLEQDLKDILKVSRYELLEDLIKNPGNYICGGKNCTENKERYEEIKEFFLKLKKKKEIVEKEIQILKNIISIDKKFELQKSFIHENWRIKKIFENFKEIKIEIDKIKLLGNKKVQNKKIKYLLNKMLKHINANNLIVALLDSDLKNYNLFIELKEFLTNLDKELLNILTEHTNNNKNKSLLIQYEKFKIFKDNLGIIENFIINNNIKLNVDVGSYVLYNLFFKNIIDLNIIFKFSKKNRNFLLKYKNKLGKLNELKKDLLNELNNLSKSIENKNWKFIDEVIFKPVKIKLEDKIQPEKIERKKRIIEQFLQIFDNITELVIDKNSVVEAIENITDEKEKKKILKELENVISEKKYIKEIFYQLELKKEQNFIDYSNKLFLQTFGKYNIEQEFIDNELKIILEDLIEEIIKLYSKNNILMEELTTILSIIKNEPLKFKKLYKEVKSDNSISEEEKLTYFIFLLKSNYELNFNVSYEEFKTNPKKYAKGYSGEIDRIIFYKEKNKLEGYDVTYDKSSIIDNKNNETRMYQIIRHFVQLMLLKKEKKVDNIEYNFLANFNINNKDKFSDILYKLNNQLFLAFVKDDHINYEEVYFYILVDKYLKSNPNKIFKTVEELIDTVNKHYLGENYTYKDFRNLIKIDGGKKDFIIEYLKNNPDRLEEIFNNNLFFKMIGQTKEIKNIINTKVNEKLTVNLTPYMANEIVSNISNFYTFIKYSKLNITPLIYIKRFELPIDENFINISINNFIKNFIKLVEQTDNYLEIQSKNKEKNFEKKYHIQNEFKKIFSKYQKMFENISNINTEEKIDLTKNLLEEIEDFSFKTYKNQTIRHSLINRLNEIKETISYLAKQLEFKQIEKKLENEKIKIFIEKLETKYNKNKIDFKKKLLTEIRSSKYINTKLGFLLDKKMKEYYLNYEMLHPNQQNSFKNKFFEKINLIKIFNLSIKMIENKFKYWNVENKEILKEKLKNYLIHIKNEETSNKYKILKIFKMIEYTNAFKEPIMVNIIIYKTTGEIIKELLEQNTENIQETKFSLDF